MRRARVGEVVEAVHLRGRQRNGRRVEPQLLVAVALDERARIAGIALLMEHARGMGVEDGIVLHLLEGGEPDDAALWRAIAVVTRRIRRGAAMRVAVLRARPRQELDR